MGHFIGSIAPVRIRPIAPVGEVRTSFESVAEGEVMAGLLETETDASSPFASRVVQSRFISLEEAERDAIQVYYGSLTRRSHDGNEGLSLLFRTRDEFESPPGEAEDRSGGRPRDRDYEPRS